MKRNGEFMRTFLFIFLICFFMSGCGISVVPLKTESNNIDLDKGISISSFNNINISVKILDLEVSPYVTSNNVTSFYLTINNQNSDVIKIPLSAFILVDDSGNQYSALEPSQVVSLARASSEYLIPYPFVGYYYLGDKEQASFENVTSMTPNNSTMSFPKQPYPNQILLESLPVDSVLPQGQISGSIFFAVDLYEKQTVELRIYLPETPPPSPASFVFPFKISR